MPGEAHHWAGAGHGGERRSPAYQSYPSLGSRTGTTRSKYHRRKRHSTRRRPGKAKLQRIHAVQVNRTESKASRDSSLQPPYSGYQRIHTNRPAPAACNRGSRNRSRAPDSSNKTRQIGIPRTIHARHPGIPRVLHGLAEPEPRHPKSQTTGRTTPKAESTCSTNTRAKKARPWQDQDAPPTGTPTATNRAQWQWHQTVRDRATLPDRSHKRPS